MRPAIRLLTSSCLLVPALAGLLGAAEPAPAADPKADVTVLAAPGTPGGVVSTRITLEARVTAKDEAKRTVTLVGADKQEQTIAVPESAVNFPQVKVGDAVVATIAEEIIAVVIPAGHDVAQGEAIVAGLAKEGGKPGAVLAAAAQVRAKVVAIDAAARTATVAGDDGVPHVLPVRADIDLAKHQVGDQVVMRVTRAVSLEVKAPKP